MRFSRLHGIPALGIRPGIDWDGDWKFSQNRLEVYIMGEAVMVAIHQAPETFLDLTVIRCIPGDCDLQAAHLQGQDLFSIINDLRTRSIFFTFSTEAPQARQIRELAA